MPLMLQTLDFECFFKFDVMKKHGRIQVMFHTFLTLLTGTGEWPASRLVQFTSEENDHHNFCRFSDERHIFANAGNRTPTFQPIANHHIE
jgi:hypothetical protein